jgi:hypothetical protein
MSLNSALNATIALIENRPAQFREMLREPTSDVKNISPVYSRMIRSLDFYAATKIRIALMAALHVQPTEEQLKAWDELVASGVKITRADYERIFFEGVTSVEKVFEGILNILEGKE